MRLVLFVLILGTTLLAAAQNDDARARLRGSRRFALTSPGLAASRRTPRVEGETQAVELDAGEPETSASPQSSTRGTQLLRRGRPGIGTRTDSQVVSQRPAEVVAEEGPVSRPVANPNRADGLRVRRPLKLPATTTAATTTTTTTTTEASVSESVVTEKTGAEIQQAVMMEEKILENEAQPIEEPEMAKELPAEEVAEVPKPAEKSKSLPKPKLRPIPIKVGLRKESKSDLKEAPAESEPPNDQEQTPSVTDAVSSHRFSSRPRPTTRIESRGRPRGTRPTSDQPAEQQIAAEEPKPATARTGSRSRLFAAREGRTPSRRITSTQTRAEETPVENTAELSRSPNIKELRTLSKYEGESRINKQSPRISRPVFKRPHPRKNQAGPSAKASKDVPNVNLKLKLKHTLKKLKQDAETGSELKVISKPKTPLKPEAILDSDATFKVNVILEEELTPEPEVTTMSEVHFKPEITSKPEVFSKPDVTASEINSEVSIHQVFSESEVTTTSETHSKSEITPAPEVFPMNELSSEPELPTKSEVHFKSDIFSKPEVAMASDVRLKPDITPNLEAFSEPEVTTSEINSTSEISLFSESEAATTSKMHLKSELTPKTDVFPMQEATTNPEINFKPGTTPTPEIFPQLETLSVSETPSEPEAKLYPEAELSENISEVLLAAEDTTTTTNTPVLPPLENEPDTVPKEQSLQRTSPEAVTQATPKAVLKKPPVLRKQFIEDTAEEKVTPARPQRKRPALNRKPADEVVEDTRPRQNKRIQPRPESKPVADVPTHDGFHAKMPPPPMIAPEAQTPRPGFPIPNYGGTDLVFRAGEVQMTQIGTAEDTPLEETRRILSGLGSRRRGLGRPIDSAQLKTIDAQIGQGKSPPLSSVPVDNEHVAAENNDPLAQDYIYDYEYV